MSDLVAGFVVLLICAAALWTSGHLCGLLVGQRRVEKAAKQEEPEDDTKKADWWKTGKPPPELE